MSHTGKSSRRVSATEEGQKLLREAKATLDEDGKCLTFKKLTDPGDLYEKTGRNFFNGKPVYERNARKICDVLNLKIEDVVNPEDLQAKTVVKSKPRQKQLHEFRQKCQNRLVSITESLITNPLTAKVGITHRIDDVYVNLRLGRRKQLTKCLPNVSSESQLDLYEDKELYKEEQFNQTLEAKEFFQEVLKPRLNSKSYRKPIAIVGEVGAGKSIFLRKVGDWIFSNKESSEIAIWVSLKNVGTRNLSQYLLEDWLRDVVGELESVAPKWKSVLKGLVERGQVWLLLDGVEGIGEQSLTFLAEQLQQGWMRNIQVVLTCGLHVWDCDYNILADKVETYYILPLSYGDSQTPNQVAQLSANFFRDYPNLDKDLQGMLGEFCSIFREQTFVSNDLKDFVRNPLRLVMLCYTWKLQDGLPETKAELFKGFVEQFYNLQQPKFSTNTLQQDKLNSALGKLAQWAIEQPTSPELIRLDQIPKSLVQTLGYVDDAGSLLHLALELGWLIPVGLAAENPNKIVYAFFHPTFQKYFAANAIDDWDFFLPREHIDPSLSDEINPAQFKHYRFLNPRWKEVVLFWLEREDVPLGEKAGFIGSVLNLAAKIMVSEDLDKAKKLKTIRLMYLQSCY